MSEKNQKLQFIRTPASRFEQINRWNLCQKIAQYLYYRALTDAQLQAELKKQDELYHEEFNQQTVKSK